MVDVGRREDRHHRPGERRHGVHDPARELRGPARPPARAGRHRPRRRTSGAGRGRRRRRRARRRLVQACSASPDDLSSCEADSEIFQLARALPTRDRRRDRRRSHPRRDRPPRRRHSDHRVLRQGAGLRAHRLRSVAVERARRPAPDGAHDLRRRRTSPKPGAPPSRARTRARRLRPIPRSRPRSRPRWRRARASATRSWASPIARAIAPAYAAESPLGNLFADLMRAAHPEADVALTSGGSLRADLPAGALTYGQLHEALPFDDRFVDALRHGRRPGRHRRAQPGAGRRRRRPLGRQRAAAPASAATLQVTLTRPDGRPVGPGERLTLVTSEFLATGGGGVLSAERSRPRDPGRRRADPRRRWPTCCARARRRSTPTIRAFYDPAAPAPRLPGPPPRPL